MAEISKEFCGHAVIAVCTLIQGLWLISFEGNLNASLISLVFLVAILFVALNSLFKGALILNSTIASLAAGGLGMLIGSIFDGGYHATIHLDNFFMLTMTWTVFFMVLFCLPLCTYFCSVPSLCFKRNILLHTLACIPMIVGMAIPTYFHLSLSWTTSSSVLEHHLLMLMGMAAGMLSGMTFLNRILTVRCHKSIG